MVTTFCQEVQLHVRGDSHAARLVQENRRSYATYKRDIRGSAPKFLPFPTSPDSDSDLAEYLDLDDDDDDDDECDNTGTPPTSMDGYMYLEDLKSHIEKFVPI